MNAKKLVLMTVVSLVLASPAFAQDAATPSGKSDTTTGGGMKSDSMQGGTKSGDMKAGGGDMQKGSTANGTSTLGGPAGKTPDPANK